MSFIDDEAGTPAPYGKIATTRASLSDTMVIGIFGSSDRPAALLRAADGTITRVTSGDAALGGVVTTIDAARVIIVTRRGQRVLELPAP